MSKIEKIVMTRKIIVDDDLIQPVCQAFESWPVVWVVVPAFKHQIVPGQENKKSNRIEFLKILS